MLKTIIYVLAVSLLFVNARAKGDVYTTGVASNFSGGQGLISAWTQPNLSGDGAIIGVNIDNSNVLTSTTFSVGIGHVWYSVMPGTIIDPAFALAAPAFLNAFTGAHGQIQLTLGQTFLLGFWLDANGNAVPGLGDRFGWASFTYNTSGLSLVSSAIESTGTGIIAGTTTAVPEPSTACLLFLVFAAAAPWISRCRRCNPANGSTLGS